VVHGPLIHEIERAPVPTLLYGSASTGLTCLINAYFVKKLKHVETSAI